MPDAACILLVEDDPAVGEVVQDILLDEGYEVHWGLNGQAGLDFLADRVPSVIVLDLMMPIMDGHQFRAVQRTLPGPAGAVPVVVLSGMRDAQTAGVELGAAATLTKPFDLEELVDTIRRVLDDRALAG